MKLPPVKLRRLHAATDPDGRGPFIIVAEPLPIAIHARMNDAEHLERRAAECAAIDAEWERIGLTGSKSGE